MSSTTTPMICKDLDGDDRWLSIHKRFVQECKEKDPDVMFIGDCILESLQFTDFWNSHFVPMHCLNFSIRNDRIQNVLWRLQNGELENVRPKAVVLHVGTNNICDSAEEVADGLLELVATIRSKLPEVYIIIPTLLPRGNQPNALRDKNAAVNRLLKERCIGKDKVQTVCVDGGLIQSDGSISHHDMFDYLNLTNVGCKKVFEPVWDLLHQILTENEKERDLTPSE
ncbi:platelet-activating factor acetylhydrolase IB subunit beta homolog [Toxorhynchites rutilus septentrionalis]|uniref:platelet-activating factor acetylhydrolase IB subunit beta homolog n=1 Tax=Toxorhynchites rutilus septentrionalis TaxID=329112 RepID=UPI002479139E|nr:platelet-activating factor acetylhydrolase IB subunit beta homolog [Toxorhynchites rutilus septentrionalis]